VSKFGDLNSKVAKGEFVFFADFLGALINCFQGVAVKYG